MVIQRSKEQRRVDRRKCLNKGIIHPVNIRTRSLRGLEKAQGHGGILLVEHGSISKEEYTLLNKKIKFITNIVYYTKVINQSARTSVI